MVDDGEQLHLPPSASRGMPSAWEAGHPREVRRCTSQDLSWTYRSTLDLGSAHVVDACVHTLPGEGHRLWCEDEEDGSHTGAADSDDLTTWEPQCRTLDVAGTGEDDDGVGLHADVVVVGGDAPVVRFTHPAGRATLLPPRPRTGPGAARCRSLARTSSTVGWSAAATRC